MAETVAGFPFWELAFDERGEPRDPAAIAAFLAEVPAQGLTDLFIFSHGWNNDRELAENLYRRFFGAMRHVLNDPALPKRRQARIGTAGVIWPAILFPDERPEEAGDGAAGLAGGAAGLGDGGSEGDLAAELKKVFTSPQEQATVDELVLMLEERPRDEGALKEFKAKLASLIDPGEVDDASPDVLEGRGTLTDDSEWRDVFDALADDEPAPEDAGGAAGFGDVFDRLWRGAKGALRVTTYWKMKNRAGLVGTKGLGPLVGRLAAAAPGLAVHLLGHSFGARLVSYTVAALPEPTAGRRSSVKSLFLLQGAFSHFTFADSLPFDRRRKGDLAGMAARVDGPLLTTHSLKDSAVGRAYPLASIVARQDASAAGDPLFRWGAMGHDGAQEVSARSVDLGKAGTAYPFEPGRWVNLDGNRVIVNGGPPAGAHSDIVHPHTAWAALAAAGIG